MEKMIPGTEKKYTNQNPFNDFKKMIELTDGISLSQVCSITDLDPFVIQNWVKRGYVARPVHKKYYEKQLARILMINSLKDAMRIEEIGDLMTLINGDVEDESDDLISEEDLYSLFSKVIYSIKDEDKIKEVINKIYKEEKIKNTKIEAVLEIMVHAYIAGVHKRSANKYLEILKTI